MDTVWGKYFMDEQHLLIDDIANRLAKFADILNQPGGPTKGAEFIDELAYMMSALTEAQTWMKWWPPSLSLAIIRSSGSI